MNVPRAGERPRVTGREPRRAGTEGWDEEILPGLFPGDDETGLPYRRW